LQQTASVTSTRAAEFCSIRKGILTSGESLR